MMQDAQWLPTLHKFCSWIPERSLQGGKNKETNKQFFWASLSVSIRNLQMTVSMQILNWLLTSQNPLRAHMKLPSSCRIFKTVPWLQNFHSQFDNWAWGRGNKIFSSYHPFLKQSAVESGWAGQGRTEEVHGGKPCKKANDLWEAVALRGCGYSYESLSPAQQQPPVLATCFVVAAANVSRSREGRQLFPHLLRRKTNWPSTS